MTIEITDTTLTNKEWNQIVFATDHYRKVLHHSQGFEAMRDLNGAMTKLSAAAVLVPPQPRRRRRKPSRGQS